MQRMLLVLKRSPDQETALRKLLDDQQDKNSPNYHKWLTPEQFGTHFGPSDADLQTITSWLQSHGFQVGTTKGRTVLEFSGSASQVQEAFHTSIHKYIVKGEQHWANARDPEIPAALAPAIKGVLTLHNFRKKPTSHFAAQSALAKFVPGKKPEVTFTSNGRTLHALAPADYRVIYNMNALPVIGQSTIAVVGRSNLYAGGEDIFDFQSVFGGGGSFSILLDGPDPGDLGGGEEAEATLDATWSSALAPGASVTLVISASTDTTDGVDLSEKFIIEQNLAAIMTESFGACELYATDAQLAGATAMAEQAAAQGITYIVSSGDNGANACDSPDFPPATNPISVNFLASTAYNVAVGGTMFNEHGADTTYWLPPSNLDATAISYIPENVWNESSASAGLWAGSGGASAGNIQSGFGTTSGVPKPNWQSGDTLNIPQDGVRDLPDVSLTSASHDGYLLCLEGSCVPDNEGFISLYLIGGTSAAAPSFAAIMALVNDQNSRNTGELRQGLANYVTYLLAATQAEYPSQCNGSNTSAAPAASCIFNDVTVGNNVVPGELGSNYAAGVGFDLATGLGSINVGNLVSQWNSVTFRPTATTLALTPLTNISHGSSVGVNISVAPNSGTGVPTGNVSLMATAGPVISLDKFTLSNGMAVQSTSQLPGGTYDVVAHYAGDATFAPSDSPLVQVTVGPEASATTVSVLTGDQNGNPVPFTSGPFGSFVYLRADVAGQSGNGIATGNITFIDTFGAIPGGTTFRLNTQGNTATPNGITTFDSGTHTISASYEGDVSFNASTTTQSQTFTITPGFVAELATSQSAVLISAPGGTGSISFVVSNSSGFNGTISFTCSGLPLESKCTFSPSSLAASGTMTTTPVSVMVSTTAPTANLEAPPGFHLAKGWMVAVGLIFPGIVIVGGKNRGRGFLLMLMLLLVAVVPSCGGGSHKPPPDPGTPTGTSNVTISVASGSTVTRMGFTLVVQ
jgi:hypothetical protein